MRKIIFAIPRKFKFVATGVLVFSIANSLILEGKIGLISVFVLIFYCLINIRYENAHKISFLISLALLALATLLYITDMEGFFNNPVKKLSEWAFLFILAAVLQLLVPFQRTKFIKRDD